MALSSVILFFYINLYVVFLISFFLAINQAFTWTTTVTSQIDISGKSRAGLATGINEMSGYLGVALGNLFASNLFSVSYVLLAIISLTALLLSFSVMETKTLLSDPKEERVNYISITGISLAGLIEKFVDSSFFILIPTYLLLRHYSLFLIGIVVGSYTFTWALSQPLFGYIADVTGKRRLITCLPVV